MPTALSLNRADPYPFAKGALNAAFADRAATQLTARRWRVLRSAAAEDWDVEADFARFDVHPAAHLRTLEDAA